MILEDKIINLPKLKKLTVGAICVYGIYKSFDSIISQNYLYDLALEYKDYVSKDTLISSNCENII